MGNESIEEIPRHRKCRYYVPGGFTEPGKNYCAPNAKTLGEQWEQRKEMTRSLSLLTEKLINPHNDPRIYWAKEVTFDYSSSHAIRVDYMKFKPVNNTVGGIEKGDFYCYEVKSSVEDFHSKNGHNFIGDFNYYIMPEEVYAAVSLEIPYAVGVYCPDGAELRSVKKAKRKDLSLIHISEPTRP